MASTGNGSEDEAIRPPGAIKSRDGASTDGAPKDDATLEGSGGLKAQPAAQSPTLSCEDSSQNASSKARRKLTQFVATSSRHAVTGSEDADFNANLAEAVRAIEAGIYPELISGGSSGSYFVYDVDKKFLAVFKPKDEEPFASLNPKWPKFFQRILCFCCFGRACLIPNHGYLSETGASLVDARLKLDIVPKTRIVKLSSPTFFYGRSCWRRRDNKAKEGSYQVFVNGYKSSGEVFNEWNKVGWQNALNAEEVAKFTVMFQKMCVLDYLIRNTDRHMDNWLIRHIPGEELVLAAIDNGLAFPVKHPESASRFRKFPFAWATLHWAKKQWDPELREHLLKLLTPQFLHDLCKEIKILFSHDTAHNHLLVNSQLRVFRGQAWNLKQSLDANETPCDLVKRPPVVARRRYRRSPTSDDWSKCFVVKQADYSDPACC
ncbi:phosphatidylinositol 3 [Aphelenchoides avenae]|nr:phosphatidylinositol 3 [Aphelenchus avenae]